MNRLDNHQPLSTQKLTFAKIDSISQSFISHKPSLNMVNICLRNPSRSMVPLKFELIDSSGAIKRSIDFTGGNIDNFDCTRFQFDPVLDSSGQQYLAKVSIILDKSLDLKAQESSKGDLYIEAHDGRDYVSGAAYLGDTKTELDLHFKTMYYQKGSDAFRESYQGFFTRLTYDPFFFLAFSLIIGLVIYKFTKAK